MDYRDHLPNYTPPNTHPAPSSAHVADTIYGTTDPPMDHSLPLTFPDYDSYDISPSTFSSSLQFQIPNFLINAPPTLPPGGGAEALSGMLPQPGSPASHNPAALNWFVHDFLSQRAGPSTAIQRTPPFSDPEDEPYSKPLISPVSPVSPIHNSHAHQQLSPSSADPYKGLSISIPPNIQPLLYSVTGFDVMSILAKVANRPRPKVNLGPVDFTCSFCFVDVLRHDNPIVYASPSFYELTGYSEAEVLGKNCRFLQHPEGKMEKGSVREHTSPDAVQIMRKSLLANKECQVSLVNFRKGGKAFVNLVTVIPVPDDDSDQARYHVGFQIDLTHQPNAILERLNSGSYVNSNTHLPPIINHRKSKTASRSLFTFLNVESASTDVQRSKLNNFLIGHSGDFMHVLSLKGLFQYVSPSVRDTLEYEPEDLVGRSISDICHPADLTPLIRDLKDTSLAMPGGSDNTFGCVLKTTSLLYRARTKSGSYVWIEAHGRLHIETGKGRKSVILSGRRRSFSLLSWRSIDAAGGLSEREFWALLSPHGHWLSVPDKVNTLLKRKPEDLRGKLIQDMLPMPIQRTQVHMTLRQIVAPSQPGSQQHPSAIRVQAELQGKENRFHCQLIFYAQGSTSEEETILCQVKVGDIVTLMDAQFASTSSQMGFAQPIITTPPPLAYSGARDSDSNSDDVLKELSHTNHTSWQYELTSLRMANENLAREIGELESKLGLLPSLRSLNLATSVSPSTGTALTSKPKTKKRRRDVDSPE